MNKYAGKLQGMASRIFHGMFAAIWLMLLPGIFIWGIWDNVLLLIPVIIIMAALVLYRAKPVFPERLKIQALSYIDKYSVITAAVFLMVIQVALQVYFGYEMAVTPAGDRNVIFKQASEMALNNVFKTSDQYNFYFLRYPNNQMLLLLEMFWFMILKAVGTRDFLYGNMVLNILAIDAAILLCMVLVNRKYGKRAAVLFQVMSLLFIPFYTYIPFVYTDTLVLPIVAGLLLCYQFVEENFKKNRLNVYIWILAMGVLTWLGFELKPTVAIITVACAIHMVVAKNWKRGLVATLALILVFGSCRETFKIVMDKTAVVDQTDYDKENFPYAHWVMMGLKGTGNYNLADREYTSSFETKEDKEKGDIRMIKKRLKEYGVPGLLLHQYIKAVSTWSNGKYDMEFHLQRQPVRNSWLQSVFFKDGKLYPLYDSYCTLYQWTLIIFIAISVVYGLLKKEMGSAAMWKLALFGLFLFLSIWETKARYVMHFVPVMMLIVIDMLYVIHRNLYSAQKFRYR